MKQNEVRSDLPITLEFRSKKPIGEQIYTQLLSMIRSQRIKTGDQLPTVRELAERLKINFNTVARAYRQLDREGLISTQQGRGTYILETGVPTGKSEVFDKEVFLAKVNAFLQAEANRSEISTADLWNVIANENKKRRSMGKTHPRRKKTFQRARWRRYTVQLDFLSRKQTRKQM